MIYSFMGWLMETTIKSINAKKFINRGFLIGPYCPIYGWGCLLIIILLEKYTPYPIGLFCMSIIICTILEYLTSYLMEKIFNARWWDYSTKKFNLNGRVCLDTMIPFGILGTLMMYFVNPFFTKILNKVPTKTLNIIAIILLIVFTFDNIISYNAISKFKGATKKAVKDNTEEITEYVKKILSERNILTKRLIKAYPNVKAKIKKFVTDRTSDKENENK